MNQGDFASAVYEIADTRGNDKKELIRKHLSGREYAIALFAGQRFDDIGIGKKTFSKAADNVFDFTLGDVSESNWTEALKGEETQANDWHGIYELYKDCKQLADLSGNDQQGYLESMFTDHRPDMVAFSVLRSKSGVFSTGATAKTVAQAMCPPGEDYRRYYGLEPDVATLAMKLESSDAQTEPVVGKAFKPMLAKDKDAPDNDKGSWNAQMKIDGYRLLVHIDNENGYPKLSAFTRNMNEVTNSLPELREIDWPEGSYILDCEVIAEDGTYKSTSERVGAKEFDRDQEMNFKVFDMIVYEGEDFTTESYSNRYSRCSKFVHADLPDDEDRVKLLDMFKITDGIHEAEKNGYEGVIVKDLLSEYKFAKRSSAWRKIKNTGETVDVIIRDFVEGEGRHDGRLGKVEVETAGGQYVGNVGTGFTDAERDEIWQNQDEWEGRLIEVTAEAFDERLRFPRFERVRDTDGEPDTIDRIREILPDDA